MALPLIPIAVVALTGMFVGSQVDDAIENTPQSTPITGEISTTKMFVYAAGAMALLWGAQKSGIIKSLK